MAKYGHVWGHYSGATPEIFLADPELLKELMVKKFDDFTDRQHFDMLPEKVSITI